MARPREFDPTEALDAMMRVFWEHGYEATTIADLEVATGVNKRSLYNTFGDKAAIFQAVIEAYGAMMAGASAALADDPPGVHNVVAMFRSLNDAMSPWGCLFTQSIQQRDSVPAVTFGAITAALAEIDQLFYRNVAASVSDPAEARRIASFLSASLQGITTTARAYGDLERHRQIIHSVVRALEAEVATAR